MWNNGGERGEDIQDTPEGCPKMLTQLEIHRKAIHVNRNPQISIEPQKKKSFHMQCLTPHRIRLYPVTEMEDVKSHSPMSQLPSLLPEAAGRGDKAHGAGCLPCLCCQHEPSKTCMGTGCFTSAEHNCLPLWWEQGGRSRLITIRGINAPSSLTPIQILTWRAARFPGKQVIQSSCCPVMTSPSPDFLHKHRADPFWQAGAF